MGVKIIQNPTLWIGSLREAQYSYDRNELLDSGAEIIWILFISPVCQTGNNFARNPELAKGCFSAKIRYSKRLRLFSSSLFAEYEFILRFLWRWVFLCQQNEGGFRRRDLSGGIVENTIQLWKIWLNIMLMRNHRYS